MGMKGTEFKGSLAKLGLSQNKGADFLGVSRRHSRRIAKGDAEIDRGSSVLLRLMIHLGLTAAAVHKLIGEPEPAKKPKPAKAAD